MTHLQFITHDNGRYDHLTGAKLALQGGCKWIQLRMKHADDEQFIKAGHTLRELCDEYQATLILDDRVELVKEIGAEGVHLGQKDMPISQARQLLGEDYIIGGTANTIEEIQKHADDGADYIGCGPYLFTSTKENLAPLLGLDGYKQLLLEMKQRGITLSLVAIGGITLNDLPEITSIGIRNVAISGAILDAADPIETTKAFINQLNS